MIAAYQLNRKTKELIERYYNNYNNYKHHLNCP